MKHRHRDDVIMVLLKATRKNVTIVANAIAHGGLVVFPTDTVYGLGCDPFNAGAVKRLVESKSNRGKPLPILSDRVNNVEKIVQMTPMARRLAGVFWPGPLTLILARTTIPSWVTAGMGSVGVRIPNHKITLSLISQCGGFLVGTSANKTGCPPSANASEALQQFGEEVDLILDGGPADYKRSSTIVDLTLKHPKVLRHGPISITNILKSLETQPS